MKRASGKIIKFVAMLAIFSGSVIVLTGTMNRSANADSGASATAGVGVSTACTFSASTHEHSLTITPGTYQSQIGEDTVFSVGCNDPDGYVVYAVGYSNEEEGTTAMIGSGEAQGINIKTGTATNGEESNWAFRIHDAAEGLVVQGDFGRFAAVPEERTAVVKRESLEGVTGLDQFSVTYAAYIARNQLPGTYSGKVLYTLFNPSSHGPKPVLPMQNFDCSSLANVGDTATLTDTRDGNEYRVRKLADGKCWMIDNLKIQNKTLTPADSDVSSNYTLPASSTSGFSSSNYDGDWVYIADGSGNNKVEYGGYYSWHAATAGTGTQSMSSGDATSSICPKGWRLPKGGSSGDFQALVTALGGDTSSAGSTALQNPDGPNFVLAGYYYNGSPYSRGSNGYYWSSTAYAANYAYNLSFSSSGVDPTSGSLKYDGYSVRCIAR